MYPILFKIGKFSLCSYSFFIAIGLILGILIVRKEANRTGEDPEKIMDLCFYLLISAIVGSRLFYMATNPVIFFQDPWEIIRIQNGGLVFYGGLIAALITGLIYMKSTAMPLWKTADMLAPAIAVGQFWGMIGCFFTGCCYGRVSDFPWAVTFTHPHSLAPTGIPIHPVQLYFALNYLIIYGVLLVFRKYKKFDGQLFWIYVLLFGVTFATLETFRGDIQSYSVSGALSVSQTVGAGLAMIAAVMIMLLRKTPETN
ncbi:MAG: prolipoprotein diacylglyceryl transferase [Thermodesulfobacteriota bacterium]|nr:prolipoprotein diacylglyceryl transferase [Thermodesulfobacteriota bacterium]